MFREKLAAWLVHAFTASGIIPGFFAVVAIASQNFPLAFLMLLLAQVIDGLDGTLARKYRVKEVLPRTSGKMMDSVIDFATYAFIPTYLLYMAPGLLPDDPWVKELTVALILVVATLYYGKEGMISEDYYFVGFPAAWNWVAFYLFYVIGAGPWINLALILVIAFGHFVPIKYVYPSRSQRLWVLNVVVTLLLIISNTFVLLMTESFLVIEGLLDPMRLLSFATMSYFFVVGLYQTWLDRAGP